MTFEILKKIDNDGCQICPCRTRGSQDDKSQGRLWNEKSSRDSTDWTNEDVTLLCDFVPYTKGITSFSSKAKNLKFLEVETCTKLNWRASHELHFLQACCKHVKDNLNYPIYGK